MSEQIKTSSIATVPADIRQALLHDETDVQTKVGHVAKFNHDGASNTLDENIVMENIDNYKKPKDANEFVGLTKEELLKYIDDPKWKRIRWVIAILYVLLLLLLLTGSILLIVFSQKCPPRPKLVWYEKEIIYEVDVKTFKDSNGDAVGDLKGVIEKLSYFESINIKSILLRSSIFNVTGGTSVKLVGEPVHHKNWDLLHLDPTIGTDSDFQNLLKTLNRKDMHLIIDLPLSSTKDRNGSFWYGSTSPLSTNIKNPCINPVDKLACRYYKSYDRLPLDFNDKMISNEAKVRLRHWLLTKKLDGVRVDLPLFINVSTGLHQISYSTINEWNQIQTDIEQTPKSKLILFDIPFDFQNIINDSAIHNKTAHSLLLWDEKQNTTIDAHLLAQRIQPFEKGPLYQPQFWQLGSTRRSDSKGIIKESQLPKEILLTLIMLLGGTPVVLYGEEIGLNQTKYPLMSWRPSGPYGGFSSCSLKSNCSRNISTYQNGLPSTSVKRQEAMGGVPKDTLLSVFRRLSKLRLQESFQFGLSKSSYDEFLNIFCFVREATGHKGYAVVLNLNPPSSDSAHISLHELTSKYVPFHVHYEYQWPNTHLSTTNNTHINSDNLLIHPQSIYIFWWPAKVIKPDDLLKTAQEDSHNH